MKEKLTKILGRAPEIAPLTFKGKKGYIALYFDYTSRNSVSELFAETEEGALENLYRFLGDKNGTDSEHQREAGQED